MAVTLCLYLEADIAKSSVLLCLAISQKVTKMFVRELLFSNFFVLILGVWGGHNLTSSGQHSKFFYVHVVEKQVHKRGRLYTSFTTGN